MIKLLGMGRQISIVCLYCRSSLTARYEKENTSLWWEQARNVCLRYKLEGLSSLTQKQIPRYTHDFKQIPY